MASSDGAWDLQWCAWQASTGSDKLTQPADQADRTGLPVAVSEPCSPGGDLTAAMCHSITPHLSSSAGSYLQTQKRKEKNVPVTFFAISTATWLLPLLPASSLSWTKRWNFSFLTANVRSTHTHNLIIPLLTSLPNTHKKWKRNTSWK